MQAFLNELSIPRLNSSQEVRALFTNLSTIYKQVRNYGISNIKVKSTFLQHEFANSYTFYSWINDTETDSDVRTLLMDILLTSPFVEDITIEYERGQKKVIETFHEALRCYGLGLASTLIYDTISFSFDVEEKWSQVDYEISANFLEEQEDGSVVEMTKNGTAKNISKIEHGVTHSDFLKLKARQQLPNGILLWEKRRELFPNLELCANVQSQVSALQSGNPEFGQILNRLFELQNFAMFWDGTPIKPTDFPSKTTPESATRLNNFSDELTIVCPDGISRLFSWHSRYTPGAGRIHFYPIEQSKKIYIGSIANQNTIK